MRTVLMADKAVGEAIARFLLDEHRDTLELVVTTADNQISQLARQAGVPTTVYQSEPALLQQLEGRTVDLGVLAWWPHILRAPLIQRPRLGIINTHPSLLPHNRGKHYYFWAIVERAPFGVSLHWVNQAVDAGPVVAQQEIPYDWTDTGKTLFDKAQRAMPELFRATYPRLLRGELPRTPQPEGVGSFHHSRELEGASQIHLDRTYTGRELLNLLRARTFEEYQGCWFVDGDQRFDVRTVIRPLKEGGSA